MSAQRLFYLDSRGLRAYRHAGKRLSGVAAFAADAEGVADFAAHLRRDRNGIAHLLVNLADEAHVLETLPRTSAGNRKSLIRRRLATHFPNSQLVAATSLGHDEAVERKERLLLSGLSDPARLAPWLSALVAAHVPLAGIHGMGGLAAPLLRRLGEPARRCLLISVHPETASLRETFLGEGQPLLSRLLPMPPGAAGTVLGAEAERLRQYLVAQRLLLPDEDLPVHCLLPDSDAGDPAPMDSGSARLAMRPISCSAATMRLGALRDGAEAGCAALFLDTLALAPPTLQFADTATRGDYLLLRARRILFAAGALPALALTLAAWQAAAARALDEEGAALAAQAEALERRQRTLAGIPSRSGIDHEILRAARSRIEALENGRRLPDTAYRLLGRELTKVPGIALDSIDWRTSPDEFVVLRGRILAEVPGSAMPPLEALAAFVGGLRAEPGCLVEIRETPPALAGGRNTTSGGTEEAAPSDAAFVLHISWAKTP